MTTSTTLHTRLVAAGTESVLECQAGIRRVDDARTIIERCAEHGAERVLLHADALPPDFFDLGTRFAGEFVQKLITYGLTVAGVFESEETYSRRMREYLHEARRGRQFRSFGSRDDALAWLHVG